MEQYHFKNNSANVGGVLAIWNTSLTLVGSSRTVPILFEEKIATYYGGAIYALASSILTTSNGTFMFHNNMANGSGGVLYCANSILELSNSQFLNNTAGYGGGGIIFNSNLHLSACNYSNQSPITVQGNCATVSGGFMYAENSNIMMVQYHFQNNSAKFGGVLYILNTSLKLVGTNDHTVPIKFKNNIATIDGGVVYASANSIITTSNGTFMFHNNMANGNGGVLYGANSIMELSNCQFMNNMAGDGGGAIILLHSNLYLRAWYNSNQSPITIQGNHATTYGGFMEASNSIIMKKQYHFKNNSAKYGGVLKIWNTSDKI
jgi:predicted outer membrane repeat protein